MDLRVLIRSVECKKADNFFMMVQFEEVMFPSKRLRQDKYRTNICANSSGPRFTKNIFLLDNVGMGNRLTLKLGLFSTAKIDESQTVEDLIKSSQLYGVHSLTLTQRMITLLRDNPKIDQYIVLTDGTSGEEVGRVDLSLRLDPVGIHSVVEEDVRQIEKHYFDPYIEDNEEIRKSLKKIEAYCDSKQVELEETQAKVDSIRTAEKSVEIELAKLKQERDKVKIENNLYRTELAKSNNLKELDIQMDLMMGSEQGLQILREKFATIFNKITLERSIYNELSEHYFQIKHKLDYNKRS